MPGAEQNPKTVADEDAERRELLALPHSVLVERYLTLQGIHDAVQERYKKDVITDHLTGLFNRRGLESYFESWRHHRREDESGKQDMIMVLDLDNFKPINDMLGHPIGDLVLQSVATILESASRADDVVGRLGGDEFAALLKNVSTRQTLGVANRIRARARGLKIAGLPAELVPTFSIGAAAIPYEYGTFAEAYAPADAALYAAKAGGKNGIHIIGDPEQP